MTNVVFFGSSSYAVPVIETLNTNFTLNLAVTTENSINDAVPKYCIANKIPYVSLSTLSDKDFNLLLLKYETEVGIVADFRLFIPPFLLNAFPKGLLNIHPSLLPKYRGPTPVQTAILNGDKETGVTIFKLDEELDHGPIIVKKTEQIFSADTGQSLYQRLFKIGADLLDECLKDYILGKITPFPQNDEEATYTKQLTRIDGYVEMANGKLERMIRAYYPWPGVWTRLTLGKEAKTKIIKFLPGEKIQVEGGKPMNYKDFLNGYPQGQTILKMLQKNTAT